MQRLTVCGPGTGDHSLLAVAFTWVSRPSIPCWETLIDVAYVTHTVTLDRQRNLTKTQVVWGEVPRAWPKQWQLIVD